MNKLNEDQVYMIRESYSAGMSQNQLSLGYGVSRQNISLIVNGKSWATCSHSQRISTPPVLQEQVATCSHSQRISTPPSPGVFNLSLPTPVVENTENYAYAPVLSKPSIASRIRSRIPTGDNKY